MEGYAGGNGRCAMCAMSAGGHALRTVLYAVLHAVPYVALYAALCSGGH